MPISSTTVSAVRGLRRSVVAALAAVLAAVVIVPTAAAPPSPAINRRQLAAQVKAEFLHAWRAYERDAWGHDELRPLTRKPYDWYGESLEMTPVDALDTLVLMGLKPEAQKARLEIDRRLSFDRDLFVKTFEINIRLLGGLLSGYELTHDARLLALATDLGRRLMPAFKSPTGLPYQFVNLRTGAVRGAGTNPAETGTLLLEFGTLSRLTGDPAYGQMARRALVATYSRRSAVGLVGAAIDVETGTWTSSDSHIGGGIDSYYEYLVKCQVLFGDDECGAMWRTTRPAIDRYLADDVDGRRWYGHADMETGARTAPTYSALAAFFPAALALSGDVATARRLQDSSFFMWQQHGIEPEVFDYRTATVKRPGYHLRPEIVESTYYLYRLTHDPAYLRMGETLFRDFVKYCRTDEAYASLASVVTKEKADEMPTYLFAETFKYFYLLFAPETTLDFDRVVFNTEAHPLFRTFP